MDYLNKVIGRYRNIRSMKALEKVYNHQYALVGIGNHCMSNFTTCYSASTNTSKIYMLHFGEESCVNYKKIQRSGRYKLSTTDIG